MLRLLLMATLSMTTLLAQNPRGVFAWWDSPLRRDLNLSVEQRRQINVTVREFRAKLIDLRAAAEKAELDVEDLFNDESIDQRRANEAIDRLANSRAEIIRTVSHMSMRLRTVLTQDQWRELQRRRPRRAN